MNDQDPHTSEHTRRDAETLTALGIFMVVMSLPVILATIWAGPPFDQAVNLAAGLVLLGIGGGMLFKGRRDKRRLE